MTRERRSTCPRARRNTRREAGAKPSFNPSPRPRRPNSEASPRPHAVPRESGDDLLELSATARRTIRENDPPAIREDFVRSIREQIAAGDYLTDDKLNAAVDRLHKEITSGSDNAPAL